ncbi:hypothetical protein [Myroides sp. LJL119]
MRKLLGITLFVAAAAIFGSCDKKDEYYIVEGGPMPTSYVYSNVKFTTKNPDDKVSQRVIFNHQQDLYLGDAVFVFFEDGTQTNNGQTTPIWVPLPKTYYIDLVQGNQTREASITYEYDYGAYDVSLVAHSADFLRYFGKTANHPGFLENLRFKVVYIPGEDPKNVKAASLLNKDANAQAEPISYEALSKLYNLDKVEERYIDYNNQ